MWKLKTVAYPILFFALTYSLGVSAEPFPTDITISDQCESLIKSHGITEYLIDDSDMMPPVAARDGITKMAVTSIGFGTEEWQQGIGVVTGLLIETKDANFLHCYHSNQFPDFILAERSKQWLLFQTDEVDMTEVHIHYTMSCGTGCKMSQVDTVFFADRTHNRYLGLSQPYLFKAMSTEPNHYPSKYFRACLNEAEITLWDDSLG